MHTSLTILIILTVVVLIVILMTSPTCKNAVNSVLSGKKQAPKAVQSQASNAAPAAKSSVKSIQRPAANEMKKAAAAMKPQVARPAQVQAARTAGPQQINFVPKVDVTAEVLSDPQYPVLNGNLLDMFNVTVDVQAKFGLSEEQVNAMAKEYKETFLDVKKDDVTRHRSVIRSQLDEAEMKLRGGFVKLSGQKPSVEETLSSMREDRVQRGEELVTAKKPAPKLSITSRK